MYTGTKRNMSAHAEEKGEEKNDDSDKGKNFIGMCLFLCGHGFGILQRAD